MLCFVLFRGNAELPHLPVILAQVKIAMYRKKLLWEKNQVAAITVISIFSYSISA